MEQVLILVKLDLGISGAKRDDYLLHFISAAKSELESKGINLNLDDAADAMLLSDYVSWNYRHRTENLPLAKNIALRINNRVVKERGAGNDRY